MHSVKQLLDQKGMGVTTVNTNDSVIDAVRIMCGKRIGCVVVVQDDNKVSGVFSERDLMQRVVVKELDLTKTKVGEVMTHPVACASESSTLEELRGLIRNKRIRHVPIVDEDHKPIAMVSIGDLNIVHKQLQEETIQYLEQYMYRP